MLIVRGILCAVMAGAVAACSRQDPGVANAQTVGDTAYNTVIVPSAKTPYRVVQVPDAGRVTGTVIFTGVPKGDTLVTLEPGQNACGKALSIPAVVRSAEGGVSDVVVWLPDVRAGQPLPFERRFTLASKECAWAPRVQVMTAGGTLNVFNQDSVLDRVYVRSVQTGRVIEEIPFTDPGQIVPFNKLLREPGVYEFFVDSRRASRAYVVVLDHPYATVSEAGGVFTIQGVPVGKHAIRAWHPVLGIAEGHVTVTAEPAAATVELKF